MAKAKRKTTTKTKPARVTITLDDVKAWVSLLNRAGIVVGIEREWAFVEGWRWRPFLRHSGIDDGQRCAINAFGAAFSKDREAFRGHLVTALEAAEKAFIHVPDPDSSVWQWSELRVAYPK